MFIDILLGLTFFLNVAVACVVLVRDPHKPVNLAFSIFALSVAAWVLGIDGFLQTDSAETALHWAKLYYFAPLAIGASSVVFANVFPRRNTLNLFKLIVLTVGLALMGFPLLLIHGFLTHTIVYHSWGKEVTLVHWEYALYSVYLLACFFVTFAEIRNRIKHEVGIYMVQAETFFVGFAASCTLGVFFNLILPALGNYRLIALGPIATTVYIVSTAYGIVRHRLFDIRLVIARSLGYLLTFASVAVLYAVIVFGLGAMLFGVHFSFGVEALLASVTGLAAASLGQLKKVFDHLTNTLFYRDAYEPQDLFQQLNRSLVSSLELDKLLVDISDIVAHELKSEYCLIGLKEASGKPQRVFGNSNKREFSAEDIAAARKMTVKFQGNVIATDYIEDKRFDGLRSLLAKNDVSVLVRLAPDTRHSEEGLGYLVLGPKKSGNPYTGQDIRVLETIANELIIAIQNALHYEEIQNFNKTLQQRVQQATRELSRTNEKLKTLDETKDEFITMASHQLRTPLTSVKGYLSMVLEGDVGKLNKQQKEMLTQSYMSSQRMVYLISDLLNLSRLNTGKFVIEPTPVDLSEIVQLEIDQLHETAKSRGISLHFDPPESLPRLMLDETKIHQVVMNLIDNAIYYTPSGGEVVVSLRETPSALEFRVVDNGIGVPKEVQHKLFTKFYRAQNAVAARPDGTGLGLFMAKKVVVAQGGAIIFESEVGKGSTFGFRFARAHHVAPAAAKPAPQSVKPELVLHKH